MIPICLLYWPTSCITSYGTLIRDVRMHQNALLDPRPQPGASGMMLDHPQLSLLQKPASTAAKPEAISCQRSVVRLRVSRSTVLLLGGSKLITLDTTEEPTRAIVRLRLKRNAATANNNTASGYDQVIEQTTVAGPTTPGTNVASTQVTGQTELQRILTHAYREWPLPMQAPEAMAKTTRMAKAAAAGDLDQLYGLQGDLVAFLISQTLPRSQMQV